MPVIPYHIYPCGDHALTIVLGDKADTVTNQKVMQLYGYLIQYPIIGVLDIIPAYTTLTVVYDLRALKKKNPATSVYMLMCEEVQKAAAITVSTSVKSRLVKIPVCYDLSLAPDLLSLAEQHLLTTEQVIQLHTGKTYRVFMIGFLPGFAYMGTVDEKINTPRKSKPRTLVPAGSVGIAGEQTGIYPFNSPGGWQLIGQTPVQMFGASKETPCYLQPGDEVQFYAITLTEFKNLQTP